MEQKFKLLNKFLQLAVYGLNTKEFLHTEFGFNATEVRSVAINFIARVSSSFPQATGQGRTKEDVSFIQVALFQHIILPTSELTFPFLNKL